MKTPPSKSAGKRSRGRDREVVAAVGADVEVVGELAVEEHGAAVVALDPQVLRHLAPREERVDLRADVVGDPVHRASGARAAVERRLDRTAVPRMQSPLPPRQRQPEEAPRGERRRDVGEEPRAHRVCGVDGREPEAERAESAPASPRRAAPRRCCRSAGRSPPRGCRCARSRRRGRGRWPRRRRRRARRRARGRGRPSAGRRRRSAGASAQASGERNRAARPWSR